MSEPTDYYESMGVEFVAVRYCECGRVLLSNEEELCYDCEQEQAFSEDAWIEDGEED